VSDTEREVVFEKKQNKASPFISFKAIEMIKESLLDTWLLKELSTWTFHIPSLILSLNLISHMFLSFHVYVCLWAFGQWLWIRMAQIIFKPTTLTLFISLLCFSHSDLIRWFISPANNACLFMRCHLNYSEFFIAVNRKSDSAQHRKAGEQELFFQTQT